jgi:hypothetical protein
MSQVHYELFIRKGGSGWVLELATEDRTRALDTAEELMAQGKASAVRVTKETLDEDTREFNSVNILTRGDASEKKKRKVAEAAPLCVSPSDLYTVHAREVIGRLLEGWLAREKTSPFELLHRPDLIEKLDAAGMELQHAVQKIAVPESQERGLSVHEVMRHYMALVQSTIDRVLNDARKRIFPNLGDETFAAAATRLAGEPDSAYVLSGGVAQGLAGASSFGDKVNRLLDFADAAPTKPGPRNLAFQVLEVPLAEILGSRHGMAEIIGPGLDLGGSLAAMTRLAAADTVDALATVEPTVAKLIPELGGAGARLANWLEGGKFPSVRAALGQRVLRELASPKRLRPADPEGEIAILRALAMCLTAAAGKMLPLEEVQHAFVERSKLLLRSDFVEAYLGPDRSPLDEVQALLWLAENVTGPANKRAASRWIGANVGALKFERELRASPDSPALKLSSLANLYRGVARVGLIPEELAPLQAKIGEIGGLVEADSRLVALVVKAEAPVVHRLTLLLRLAAGETAPPGPAADRAKAEVAKLTRAPEVRSELARNPEALGRMREMMQTVGLAA